MQKSFQLLTPIENNNNKLCNYTLCLSVCFCTSWVIIFQSYTHCNSPHPKPHIKHKPRHILMFSIRTYFYRIVGSITHFLQLNAKIVSMIEVSMNWFLAYINSEFRLYIHLKTINNLNHVDIHWSNSLKLFVENWFSIYVT